MVIEVVFQRKILQKIFLLFLLLLFFIFIIFKFYFPYLVALGLHCGRWDLSLWHVGSSSLTRDGSQTPCTGSSVSSPLDHQGSHPKKDACLFMDKDRFGREGESLT